MHRLGARTFRRTARAGARTERVDGQPVFVDRVVRASVRITIVPACMRISRPAPGRFTTFSRAAAGWKPILIASVRLPRLSMSLGPVGGKGLPLALAARDGRGRRRTRLPASRYTIICQLGVELPK